MAYCVFMHRADSIYEDKPDVQYQFPKQYLGRAKEAVGDWIVYLEPTKVPGSRGYFAIGRVQQIIPDPNIEDMFVAVIDPVSYLEFPNTVKFSDNGTPVERGLLNSNEKLSGRAQAAVRPISPQDFNRIIDQGLAEPELLLPRDDETRRAPGFEEQEQQSPFAFEQIRRRSEIMTSRIVRDRAFRRIVLRAYGERCAITGLKLINGGGRAEVNAAHIRPVEKDGPDIVQNGIALSGTVHWMFDRGLISLGDDLKILVSRHINDPKSVKNFINKTGIAFQPDNLKNRPSPRFLQWHRENLFKS